MKKKSFLSGVSAKLALAAVALTSVMFTSCEKEEFNVAPVEQADASAKISITVYDLSDGSIITDATVTNQEGTPVQGFVEVAAGADGKIAYDTKIFTATKPGYLSGVGQAVIPALNKGQFAIIPVSIYLQKEVDAAKDVAVNEDPSTVVITPVDKSETVSKEAGEEPVSFDYEFEAEDGQQVTNVEKVIEWIDINHPVTKALSDAEVNKVLKALVNSLNSGIEKKKFVETIKIYPYTKLVSVDIVTKYKTSNNTISTMVDGTLYTIPDVQIRKVESVVATPNIISIGHGHGHGHGEGNAGGGVGELD